MSGTFSAGGFSHSEHVSGNGPRVVISGIGMAGPGGWDRETFWEFLKRGERGVRWLPWPGLPACESNTNPPRTAGAPLPNLPGQSLSSAADRMRELARQTAAEAIADSGLVPADHDRTRWGIVIGTSKGAMPVAGDLTWTWPHQPATEVARQWDVQGPNLCPVAACATGLVCLWRGAELIRRGECDVVLAGSVDASLQEILLAAYRRMGVLAKINDDPGSACRPYDRERSGFLVGEGGAMFVLESATSARARGIKPYAEFISGAILSDCSGMTDLSAEAEPLQVLLRRVLQLGQITPAQIDLACLHGTATLPNDRYETVALRRVFGEEMDRIPCFGLKGAIGHLLGAAGSVETAAGLLALRDRVVPPTVNWVNPDPNCDLKFRRVGQSEGPRRFDHLLKVSLGFGGHLAAAVFRRWES